MSANRRLAALLMLGLGGCAAQSFDPHFKTLEVPSEGAVLKQLQHPKARDEQAVAVGVAEEPMRLCAWDLRGGLLWEHPVEARSAPIIAGNAVVIAEADGIVVRDLKSGAQRIVVDGEGQLVGADGDGNALVISMAYAGEAGPRGAIALVKDFRVRWKERLKLPVGVPALVGNRVVVPWATQRLSVLSADDGSELVRWHMNNTVLGHALVDRGRLYVGQHGLMRLDSGLLQPGHSPVVYLPAQRPLPGQPPLLRDGYAPVPEPASAHHKVQLEFRIGQSDPMAAENDLLALRFYRLLFALDAREDAVRWVRAFDNDVVGTAQQPGGMFVADAAGGLRFIDRNGATVSETALGRPLLVMAIRPGNYVPAAPAAPADGAQAAAPQPKPATLAEQLYAAAGLSDDRLGAGRAYAVEHLARAEGAPITDQLIALCDDQKSPEPVRLSACSQLGSREQGGEHVVEALRRRASFLEAKGAPPLGALAQAAARMKLHKAAPLLITHMEDPNTATRDLVSVLETLERLDHRPAVPAIERFVRLHHGEPEGSELTPALMAAVHALGAMRARPSRPTLEDVMGDALTPMALRVKTREAIAMMDAPPQPAAAPAAPAAEPEPEDEDLQLDPQAYALTKDLVRKTLTPLRAKLGACLTADSSRPRSGRVSMVVHGSGTIEGVFVTPTTLQGCIEPVLQGARFPATRAGRQRITHIVYGANAEKTVAPDGEKAAEKKAKPKAKGKAKPAAAVAPAQ